MNSDRAIGKKLSLTCTFKKLYMKKTILTFLFLSFVTAYAQDLVLIKFNDKPSSQVYFSDPTLMLSQKALDRRLKYNIEINMQDIPVEQSYVNQIEALGISPIAVSKWFNGVFAWCTQAQVSDAESLSFVDGVESFVRDSGKQNTTQKIGDKFKDILLSETSKTFNGFDYGYTQTQVTQIKLDFLHDLGFTGEGITIAVLDNGFMGVNTTDGFSYIRDNSQIKGTYNFVNNTEDVYNTSGTHGTMVLSTIGGYYEGEFVGTAIDADFYLFITENNQHELPDEEVNWIAAAEKADSLGVDVINTSLGYSYYDDPKYNLNYADMNGQTAYISRGAQIASEKGIMVVVSAGNEGNDSWHYITAPADAQGVFTIGAVDAYGNPAGFSSFGPTSDGRIKPDVDGMGVSSTILNTYGDITFGSGTSFSSPIMAGAMACLIGAFPNIYPEDLRQKVRASANYFNNPTNQMGYGIPDFSTAYNKCLGVSDFNSNAVTVFPNPTDGLVQINSEIPVARLQLVSYEGKIIRKYNAASQLDISSLPKGIYILKIMLQNGKAQTKKIIKK